MAFAVAIDCEGTISPRRWKRDDGKYFYHPKISIYNTDFRLIKWANNIIKPLPKYVSKRNRVTTRNKKWKHEYQIDVRGVNAVYTLLKRILPYFILKKQRARLLLEFCQRRIGRKR